MEPMNRISSALLAAVTDTLEGMAFIQADLMQESEASFPGLENLQWVALPIFKPYQGDIVIEFPIELGKQIAEALYGPEDSCAEETVVSDTLAELLNTLAGRFMKELLEPDRDFELGFPTVGKGKAPGGADQATSLVFDIAGLLFRASVAGEDFKALNHSKTSPEVVS
jgi:CheY-specific phosphatase CheX